MTTNEFIQYANERPELCEKMAACSAPEEVYAIAVAEGLTDSQEAFKQVMMKMNSSHEISDDDLDNVSAAGTATTSDYVTMSVVATVGVFAAAV